MSKDNEQLEFGSDEVELEDFDDELTDEDYAFILGPDGQLKSVIMPTEYFEVPDTVKEILRKFGIDDPESVTYHTLH